MTDRSSTNPLIVSTLATAVQWTNQVLSFGVLWYAARALPLASFGMVTISLSLYSLLHVATNFGSTRDIVPRVASHQRIGRRVVTGTFSRRFTVSAPLALLVVLVSLILRLPSTDATVYVIMAAAAVFYAFDSQPFLDGLGRVDRGVLVGLLRHLTLAATAFIIFFSDSLPDRLAIAIGYLIGSVTATILGLLLLHRTARSSDRSKAAPEAPAWTELFPLALSAFCVQIYYSADVLIIGAITGKPAAGIYSAAYKLMSFFLIIGLSYQRAHFPLLPEILTGDRLLRHLRNSSRVLGRVLAPVIVFGCLEASRVMAFIWGESFTGGGLYLVWLLPNVLLAGFSGLVGNIHLTLGNRGHYLKTVSIAAGLNVAANLLLIPLAGPLAAAWSTLLAEFTVLALFLRPLQLDWQLLLRPLLPSIVTALTVGALSLLLPVRLHTLITLALDCTLYVLLLVAVRTLRARRRT